MWFAGQLLIFRCHNKEKLTYLPLIMTTLPDDIEQLKAMVPQLQQAADIAQEEIT